MLRKYFCCAFFVALAGLAPTLYAHELGAHVHGVASLQIAVDENSMTLNFSSPLDNLLGFEHVARDAKQKVAVKNMQDQFKQAAQFFIPTAEARCTLQSVKLDSLVLDNTLRKEEAGHADLDGEFIFSCRQIGKLHELEVKLFDAFPHLRQIKVEIATLKKQSAIQLTAQQRRASW